MISKASNRKYSLSIEEICTVSVIWFVLFTLVALIPNSSPWIAAPVVVIGLVGVVGLLCAIVIGVRETSLMTYLVYVFGLGLGCSILGGLFINWFLPYIGIAYPLAKVPLVVSFDILALLLAISTYFIKKEHVMLISIELLEVKDLILGIIPVLFVIASLIGAEILNNGGNGVVTLLMLFSAAIYVFVVATTRRPMREWVYAFGIYFVSLAFLLMYSLRSGHILGWDINQEYEVFHTTLTMLVWKMSYYPGLDYNACVSITILPTILAVLTHIPSEYIFKFLFQTFFALTPVILFLLAKRYVSDPLAFLTAFLFASQTWFYEQMPALIRQEIAFIFFALLLLVLLNKEILNKTRYLLLIIFTICLVLSHYSTAYVWLALLCSFLFISTAIKFFSQSSINLKKLLGTIMLLLVSISTLYIWESFLTHTSSKVTNFVATSNIASLPTTSILTPSQKLGEPHMSAVSSLPLGITASTLESGVQTSFFDPLNTNTNAELIQAEHSYLSSEKESANYFAHPSVKKPVYMPLPENDAGTVSTILPHLWTVFLTAFEELIKVLFIDLLPIIGLMVLVVNFLRSSKSETRDLMVFSIAAYLLILLMLFVPYVQEYYNLSRLYLQMFLILSTVSIIGAASVMKYFPRYQVLIIAIGIVFLGGSLDGFFAQISGGQARITLDQPPSTLDAPYIYDGEITAAKWLATNRNPLDPIQADSIASLRLQSFAGINLTNPAIFPQTLERASYVYLVQVNLHRNLAFLEYQNNLLVYNYPMDFLNENKNLIYNDGDSRVYR